MHFLTPKKNVSPFPLIYTTSGFLWFPPPPPLSRVPHPFCPTFSLDPSPLKVFCSFAFPPPRSKSPPFFATHIIHFFLFPHFVPFSVLFAKSVSNVSFRVTLWPSSVLSDILLFYSFLETVFCDLAFRWSVSRWAHPLTL